MGVAEFARRGLAQAAAREWRGIALALFVILTVTNIILANHAPAPGGKPDAAFGIAGAVRAIALMSISVALLRVATASPRKRWAFDAGFWLYVAISMVEFVLMAAVASLLADTPETARLAATHLVTVMAMVPLGAWLVAAAVEKPLAAKPAPWFGRAGAWMPPLFATMIGVVVLASLHAAASLEMLAIAGTPSFYALALVDGLLSTLLVLVTLGLRLTAYRVIRDAVPA